METEKWAHNIIHEQINIVCSDETIMSYLRSMTSFGGICLRIKFKFILVLIVFVIATRVAIVIESVFLSGKKKGNVLGEYLYADDGAVVAVYIYIYICRAARLSSFILTAL